MFRKVFSVLLSVMFAVSMCPTVSFADELAVSTADAATIATGTAESPTSTPTTTSIAEAVISLSKMVYEFDGHPKNPHVTVNVGGVELTEGIDYDLTYDNNVEAGKAAVVVSGIGSYSGSASTTFAIAKAQLERAKVAKISSKTFSGKQFKPKPAVRLGGKKLKLGRDYVLSYINNRSAGKAYVRVRGVGNYQGSKLARFTISRAEMSGARIAAMSSRKLTGSAIQPEPAVRMNGKKLKPGRDYVLSYRNNVNAGTARVIAKGIGDYRGWTSATFKIVAPSVPKAVSGGSTTAASAWAGGGTSNGVGEVYITNTGEKYHLAWCRSLRLSKIPISRAEAIARGYEACKICHP